LAIIHGLSAKHDTREIARRIVEPPTVGRWSSVGGFDSRSAPKRVDKLPVSAFIDIEPVDALDSAEMGTVPTTHDVAPGGQPGAPAPNDPASEIKVESWTEELGAVALGFHVTLIVMRRESAVPSALVSAEVIQIDRVS